MNIKFPSEHLDIEFLKSLIPNSCKNVELFARGKRGVIFKAKYHDTKSISCCAIDKSLSPKEIDVVIKVPLPNSKANSMTHMEGNYLDKVNFFGIGPTVFDYDENYVIMEFIEGELIGEWIKKHHEEKNFKKNLMIIFENTLIQLEILDGAGINKFELTNPYKHVIVKENLDIVLIDFERTRFTNRPKNVSQFKEYIRKILSKFN